MVGVSKWNYKTQLITVVLWKADFSADYDKNIHDCFIRCQLSPFWKKSEKTPRHSLMGRPTKKRDSQAGNFALRYYRSRHFTTDSSHYTKNYTSHIYIERFCITRTSLERRNAKRLSCRETGPSFALRPLFISRFINQIYMFVSSNINVRPVLIINDFTISIWIVFLNSFPCEWKYIFK